MPQQNCTHCSKLYHAQRSTSKFCSPKCRVAHHRAPSPSEEYNTLSQRLWDTIADMENLCDKHESVTYQTNITLGAIADVLRRRYLAPKWWLCRMCQTKVHTDLPEGGNCKCGDGAFWIVLDTTTDTLTEKDS